MRKDSNEVPYKDIVNEKEIGKFIELCDKSGNRILVTIENRKKILVQEYSKLFTKRNYVYVIKNDELYVFTFWGHNLFSRKIKMPNDCIMKVENNYIKFILKSTGKVRFVYDLNLQFLRFMRKNQ